MKSVTENRIPLTVIGGFLGSGKTTLVNHVLSGLSDVRATVLVNDFGSVNIDARLIAAAGGETISLTNGCVCCSIGGDLTNALIRVIETQPAPDWIIIEASGVSDPSKIAQVGMADPALLLDGVVVLTDAESVQSRAADPRLSDTILRQLGAADILVLNKTDLVPPEALKNVRAWLATRAPDAWIYEAREATVPPELLCSLVTTSGSPVFRRTLPDRVPASQAGHAHVFSTWSFETEHLFSAERLRGLLDDMPPGILRAKGIVRTDEAPDQATIVQFAGRSRAVKCSGPWRNSLSQIVFVGVSGVAFDAIEGRLQDAFSAESPVIG